MRYVTKILLSCAAILVFTTPVWAANYDGTWQFNLKVAKTDCDGVTVGDKLKFSLEVEQTGRVMQANPVTTGVGEPYVGYTHTDGYTMALQSSCIVVPGGLCSPKVETWLFERPANGNKKRGSIVWLSIQRDSENQFVCSTTYTGTARK